MAIQTGTCGNCGASIEHMSLEPDEDFDYTAWHNCDEDSTGTSTEPELSTVVAETPVAPVVEEAVIEVAEAEVAVLEGDEVVPVPEDTPES